MDDLVIETKRLTKIYGEQTAVNAVNLYVQKGRIYGLLGRNGAGKTTIMKMILGLVSITSCEVDVFGRNIKGCEKRVYPRIGAIIETPWFYPNLTETENLEIFAKLRGIAVSDAVKSALEVVDLPYKDKKLFGKYSLGIIDHGVLLEESSMSDLEKKNSKYIFLQVSDVSRASLILERQFHLKDYSVQDDHTLRLYDISLNMRAVNKELVVQDFIVISSGFCNDTLEDYFKKITGGEGIAYIDSGGIS